MGISHDTKKEEPHKNKISPMDVARVYQFLGLRPTKTQVTLVIWEVDDDLDGYVDKEEFLTMYRRCIVSEKLAREHMLQPRLSHASSSTSCSSSCTIRRSR